MLQMCLKYPQHFLIQPSETVFLPSWITFDTYDTTGIPDVILIPYQKKKKKKKKYLKGYGYTHSPASDETDYLYCRNTVVTSYHVQYQAKNTSKVNQK